MSGRMCKFTVDGRKYEAPDIWMMVQLNKRINAGLDMNEAAKGAMRYWADQTQMMEDAGVL